VRQENASSGRRPRRRRVMPGDQPTALVTGANRGLGLEVCRQLAGRGYRVLLTARNARDGEAAAAGLGRNGNNVEFRRLDVRDVASVQALAAQLAVDEVRLDVLVNNAGISRDGFDETVARETLATNFFGPLRVADALIPHLRDGANLVMVSSGAGELNGFSAKLRKTFLDPGLDRDRLVSLIEEFIADVADGSYRDKGWPGSAYKVSKAGLNALTRILASELASRHIRVNAVCPGWVQTDMGGSYAPRSLAEGGRSIVWAALLDASGPSGGFFRDGRPIPW
jgi:NAD(P)-dependent dehydrogenase (short-subunit alcohol dehydrogenase family)